MVGQRCGSRAGAGVTHAIGVDVGGTYVKLLSMDADGTILTDVRQPTQGPDTDLPARVRAWVNGLEDVAGPALVGVACPGLVRARPNHVYWMKGRLEFLEGLDWTRALGRRRHVPVVNDAHAALIGETWLGAARGCDDVVLLTIGTGVGGAIRSGGRLLRGATGRAGHLGHIAMRVPAPLDIVNTPGSLEDAIGNCTVEARTAGRFSSTAALVAAHLDGDAEATAAWLLSVRHLAAAIASIGNVLDPARVVLGGGIAVHAGEALIAPLREYLDEYEWRPEGRGVDVVLATLGEQAGAIGAARLAMDSRRS